MAGASEMRSHGETGSQVVAGSVGGGSPACLLSGHRQSLPRDALAFSSRLHLLNHPPPLKTDT